MHDHISLHTSIFATLILGISLFKTLFLEIYLHFTLIFINIHILLVKIFHPLTKLFIFFFVLLTFTAVVCGYCMRTISASFHPVFVAIYVLTIGAAKYLFTHNTPPPSFTIHTMITDTFAAAIQSTMIHIFTFMAPCLVAITTRQSLRALFTHLIFTVDSFAHLHYLTFVTGIFFTMTAL